MRLPPRAVVAAALTLVALPAVAGRPFATEDAGVLEPGECELESFYARATARDTPRETGWWLQPGCGIGVRTQLAVGAGMTRVEGESTRAVAVAGKTYLRPLTDDQWGLTVAYQLGMARPPGESFEHDLTEVRAVVTVPLGQTLVHANVGWNRAQVDRIDSTLWAVAIERPLLKALDVGAEAYGDDRTAAWLGVGARYAVVADKFFVDASYAVQTNSARARLLTIGIKLEFGF
ncbi:MAG TPA: hypothetical protein VFR86_12425 [Burkholderiaceae bacterium]|nr:hypothetical protein [Burkholderiaceae bacterium]